MSVSLFGRRLRTWELLQTVTEQLRRETGRVLVSEAGLSATEFTVLAHLAMTPEGVRSAACARAMGWDTSRLSHQLRRLEKRGLVARGGGGDDGRASIVALTDEGRRAHRRAVGPHLEAAQIWFGDALTETQMDRLHDALAAVDAHIDTRISDTERHDSEEK